MYLRLHFALGEQARHERGFIILDHDVVRCDFGAVFHASHQLRLESLPVGLAIDHERNHHAIA